jgi:hypothetical protein
MKPVIVLLFALSLLGECAAAWAEDATSDGSSKRAAAGAATVLYTPLKAGLCVVGGAASGFAFLSSGPTAARAVANRSCKGTWILTGEQLEGKKPIDFVYDSIRLPGD